MLKKNKSVFRIIAAVAVLLVVAYMLRHFPLPAEGLVLLKTVFIMLRSTIHVSLLAAWCVSVHRRLMDPKIRGMILTAGVLMVFWLVAKTVKYEFLVTNSHPIGRYIWYAFYIPMILMPLLGVFIVDHIGQPEDYHTPKWVSVLYLPATFLLTLVLTNDLHQWVFHFDDGFANYDHSYGYGIPYFVLMAWFNLFSLYFVAMLLKKSRVPGSRKMQRLPLVIVLGAAVFWIIYALRLIKVDLTVVDCLIVTSLLESAIQSGLIPSNTNYQEIFNATTVPIQVVDRDYQPHYVSAGALPVSEEQMRSSAVGTVNMGNTLLSSAPITAGRVVWQDDIRKINALRQQLQDTQEQLSEESVLLQAETEIKENRAKADEQNRLYDRIAREVEPQLVKADALLHRIEEQPEHTRSLMAQLCVIGSYVKRRGNLLLLGEEGNRVNASELEYCIRESLENLRLGGAFTMLNSRCEGKLPLEHIVAVYDFYETMIERLLDDVTAMMVNLTCKNGTIRMNIQMGCREDIAHQVLADVAFPCGRITCDIMDEDVVIDLAVSEGGEGQ